MPQESKFRYAFILFHSLVFSILHPTPSIAALDAENTTQTAMSLEQQFADSIRPFLSNYCFQCHGEQKQEAKLKLSDDASSHDVVKNYRTWEHVVDRLRSGDMPPEIAERQPTAKERQSVIDWVSAVQQWEAARHSGDPGTVLARRLSNAEYDNTIRDLTGVDIRPTREFPVDPANEAGFDNSGESLTMSPALVKKYLAAARSVADHVVLTPTGLVFAPQPAVTETDRDKYCVQQIVSFYQTHEVDYADYFLAAWRYQHREALGQPNASLDDFAVGFEARPRRESLATESASPHQEKILSRRYLRTVWSALNESAAIGPLAELQADWRTLSADSTKESDVRMECRRLSDFVIKTRKELDGNVEKIHLKGNSDGSQPLVLWWNRQIAARRMQYTGERQDATISEARDRFCRLFPNAFSVSSRGHYADPNLGAQVRLLTAGFHLMQGYFRDDTPLSQLVLDESERAELNGLWQNLNFVTEAPIRQYKDFLFFERAEPPRFMGGAEFDFARPENKDVTSAEKLTRLHDAYVARAKSNSASETAVEAIETYFQQISADIRWIEETHLSAEPIHLRSLSQFAERAYRRPLSEDERVELRDFYRRLRTEDGLNHEDAIRDSIASLLMSPHFCYRFDLASPGEAARPLSDYELASRLSYFLWSSMPDDELLSHASAQNLHEKENLVLQARRMLHDRRIRGLATEFCGNWLDFRRFEELNSVDRDRFPTFTNELREAMYEEPLRLFVDVVDRDRSVLDFLEAKDAYVNRVLAKHYSIPMTAEVATAPVETGHSDKWFHVENASDYGRGGLLPMAVFLTKNSPGLRTSPVKRGYWVVRRLLGEQIPPPPPSVGELPKDEASPGELTLPQLLARHRDHKACAGCHQRFDSIGLIFEGFGPIGQSRDQDLGGRPVDTSATFPDGTDGRGVEGLLNYLKRSRRDEFISNLNRKLLSYALGRSLLLSDQQTLDRMKQSLMANDFRFENLVVTIVTSPQFLNKRGIDDPRDQ